MTNQSPAELKMASLLVEALNLEDIEAAEIAPDDELFGEGLGLDSIDALEISLAISQEYGVQMRAEDDDTRNAFTSLRTLTAFVERNQAA